MFLSLLVVVSACVSACECVCECVCFLVHEKALFQFSGLTFALSPACNRLISSNLSTHLPLIRHHLQLKPLDFHLLLDRSLFSPWQLGHMLGETNLPRDNVCIFDFFKIILPNLLVSSTTSPEKLSSINITSRVRAKPHAWSSYCCK